MYSKHGRRKARFNRVSGDRRGDAVGFPLSTRRRCKGRRQAERAGVTPRIARPSWRRRAAAATRRGQFQAVVPAHSASKTRVNALMLGTHISETVWLWVPAFAGTTVYEQSA